MLGLHASIEALKDVPNESTEGRSCKERPNS